MTSQTVKIMNKIGIHARPASLLVNTAGQFASDIRIQKGYRIAAAKSMINLLALRAKMDDTVTVEADGEDEKEAVQALVELISTKFGGEE